MPLHNLFKNALTVLLNHLIEHTSKTEPLLLKRVNMILRTLQVLTKRAIRYNSVVPGLPLSTERQHFTDQSHGHPAMEFCVEKRTVQ